MGDALKITGLVLLTLLLLGMLFGLVGSQIEFFLIHTRNMASEDAHSIAIFLALICLAFFSLLLVLFGISLEDNVTRKLTLGYVRYGTGTHRPFDAVFPLAKEVSPSDIYEGKVDALVIWGGSDISPSLYGELPSVYTGASTTLSLRDKIEKEVCEAAITTGIPIIGVCRGAQLACALAGGKLIQHVDGHHEDHLIKTYDGRRMITSSVHHQMMYPWKVDHHLIAWASQPRSHKYYGGPATTEITDLHKIDDKIVEPEIVFFPKIKALAIQGHPEFMAADSEFVTYCNGLVKKYLIEGEI